jgi:hypothetical protein
MAFVSGPRQVGKTTVCQPLATAYLNWDDPENRRTIMIGMTDFMSKLSIPSGKEKPLLVLDELHKNKRWKGVLKGLFDGYGGKVGMIVTGSARMDIYRKGGDSLMGRYFPFHMHPFSVAELIRQTPPVDPIQLPGMIKDGEFKALWEYGGFPEPFIKRERSFSLRWRSLRRHQLLREEVRDTTRIQELAQLEHLEMLLAERSGQQLTYGNLASEIGVTLVTARKWVETLAGLYHGFLLRPWYQNVARSLRKEPKWYLRDWSGVEDPGARTETFIACHLLKAVEGWTDMGLGVFELRYLRDKDKREVDFVVIRDRKPWLLVEAKKSDQGLNPALGYFQKRIKAEHAFQVVLDLPYAEIDCFEYHDPTVVPALTFLSQLI